MPMTFIDIKIGSSYSRSDLAKLWGYAGVQALSRGVVTPKDDNKIILFVTHEKQSDHEQYEDELTGTTLRWEGPTDHFAEDRMLAASHSGDEIHLFYRDRHHTDFLYQGQLRLVSCERQSTQPSKFVFQVLP